MITATRLDENKINLTVADVVPACELIHCELDGEILISFTSGSTPISYTMVAGADRMIGGTISGISIVSGTFTVS